MNILNGDSAAGSFKSAFHIKSDELLVFRDVLSCGPLKKFCDIEDWQELRISFWDKVCADNCVDINALKSLSRDFYDNLNEFVSASECKLWIGTGLSDQLLLSFIVQLFDTLGIDFGKLSIVQFEKFKNNKGGYCPVKGLGLLNPTQIKDHPLPYKISEQEISHAKLAWEAFTDSSPKKYLKFMDNNDEVMTLLQEAMSYVLYRYPRATNGLSCWDERLLKNILAHGPKATSVIGHTLADGMNGLDFVGDWYLFSRLKNLASLDIKYPPVKVFPQDCPMCKTEVQITEFGKLALEQKVNVVHENGISDWVGGVHLDSRNKGIWIRENNNLYYQEAKQA